MPSKFFIAAFLRSQIVPLKTSSKYSLSTLQPSSLLGYSNAMATTASALAAPLMDAAGHAQIIAKHQKELAALNKKNGVVPRPRSSPKTTGHKYCYGHGYQKSHIGTDCNVLIKANAQRQYTAQQHLAATDHAIWSKFAYFSCLNILN